MELISRNPTMMMAMGQALSPAWSYLEWKTLLIRTTGEPWRATIYVKTSEFHENTGPPAHNVRTNPHHCKHICNAMYAHQVHQCLTDN
jgi:hypothetical protein